MSNLTTISFSRRIMLHDTGWFFSLKCASGQVTFVRTIYNILHNLQYPSQITISFTNYNILHNLQYPSQISTSIHLVPVALSPRIKPRLQDDNSPLSFAEFKNKWSYSFTICLYGACRQIFYLFHYKKFSQLYVFQWRTDGGWFGVFKPPQNSEVLTKLSRIPSSVENTSVTT